MRTRSPWRHMSEKVRMHLVSVFACCMRVLRLKWHGTHSREEHAEIDDGISLSDSEGNLNTMSTDNKHLGFQTANPEVKLEEIHNLKSMGLCDGMQQ
jgi:hypothetical protein